MIEKIIKILFHHPDHTFGLSLVHKFVCVVQSETTFINPEAEMETSRAHENKLSFVDEVSEVSSPVCTI